jgi:hypothetical protein
MITTFLAEYWLFLFVIQPCVIAFTWVVACICCGWKIQDQLSEEWDKGFDAGWAAKNDGFLNATKERAK